MPLIRLSDDPEIYNIKIPLPKNALKDLNVYVIVSDGQALVIDTGFRMEECRVPLLEGIRELGIAWDKITLFVTHMHSDHAGQIDLFTDHGCKAYMSSPDIARLRRTLAGTTRAAMTELYLKNGFPEDELAEANKKNPIYAYAPMSADKLIPVEDGEILTVGHEQVRCILTPGHTPGHMCLYMEKYEILFAGDHILYDITPNITMWVGVDNSLENYLSSLSRIEKIKFKVAYPAHRELHDHAYDRIREIRSHHEARLNEALGIVRDRPGCNVYEVTKCMKWSIHGNGWDNYPAAQKWFAVGEAMAHLDWLAIRGYVEFREIEGNTFLYPTDNTQMVQL